MRSYLIASIGASLFFSCTWFCLWVLSYAFILAPEQAILLFPFALRLGLTLHSPMRFWPAIYLSEWLLMIALATVLNLPQWQMMFLLSLLSLPIIYIAKKHYVGEQWQRLSIMGVLVVLIATLNTLIMLAFDHDPGMTFLLTITGSLMIVPSCYLIWSYLFQNKWEPLNVDLLNTPITLHSRRIIFYASIFILNIIIQVKLPIELRQFAPFCLAIPIIIFAFRYGWKGALLATLLNSIALIAARNGVSDLQITDLLLSLSAQSLTGILLGMGIERQHELNNKLRHELTRNHTLSRQLVKTEESIRREIARELHDEIGQNITAIRTQASIIDRVEKTPISAQCARMIEQLSLNIYDTTKDLLVRLRPKTLDDLGLKDAIYQLLREMQCNEHGIKTHISWQEKNLKDPQKCDTTQVTLYRICQEALNNIIKYAHASEVNIDFRFDLEAHLNIRDNGIGFDPDNLEKGLGLQGIKERVQVLGGKFELISSANKGTQLNITLPLL
ncbi:sensory histidine kinase UhpB [Psychromonas sp. CNPT3]|uniref:signal transduction histidine-protein kinase/phosphatase UhpB n=1 Tax=Psychromonas sp. CNPT3 TaxID=314282 RepID=UPI00006E9E35|nr:signal transduction histidine-protein kinase/phosphatase UhpB [Psychromonas sp. CNPT3]AGH80931.1 sensory histidine kinase UhpB [Psychromonas sp. CNPT3]